MPKLFSSPVAEQTNLIALILSSAAIPYTLAKADRMWEIWVQPAHMENAEEKIKAYFIENPEASLLPPTETTHPDTLLSGLWGAALLILFHVAITYHHAHESIVALFGANAARIVSGEIYRAVTALMIHSGEVHLIANVVGTMIFGTAVCMITGPGAGWLLILLSGVIGNLANAVFYQSNHVSVGASTAVFGAIGILSAIQLRRKSEHRHARGKAWLPLAAGLGLLGILGSSGERTDLMAHLFGLITGLFLGFGHAAFLARPLSTKVQFWCGVLSLTILSVAWLFKMLYNS
ncbi:MAG: rhomboid family intramembrane serine protease [Desulfobacterales bacterium]|jgi:membrane associated rhomboid family serine protease|nr:rhomboid family intramembrane serine protease [Desulfobacterales bacterium]